MKFPWGELPDEHAFFYSARPLVDWSFKVIAWLGICASIQIAAEATNSRALWTLLILAYFLILFFLRSFFDWLLSVQFRAKPKTLPRRLQRTRKVFAWVGSSVISLGLFFVMQKSVDRIIEVLAQAKWRRLLSELSKPPTVRLRRGGGKI